MIGQHKILLIQSFDNFANVNPYSEFSVVVLALNKPPYFEQDLVAQSVI